MNKTPVAVLVSGGGTNLQALIDAAAQPDYPARIGVVVSNRRAAYGLDRARAAGIEAVYLPCPRGTPREQYDAKLVAVLQAHAVEWVCLAGFMRIVTPVLLEAFPQRVLNIHPSLLPAFPGLDGVQQAYDHGVRVAGATVHFVDGGMDTGPIISQGTVEVRDDDDVEALKARVLAVEHQLFPAALRAAVEGELTIDGRKVRRS